MILLLEAIFIHGFLISYSFFITFFDFYCIIFSNEKVRLDNNKLSASEENTILWGLPRSSSTLTEEIKYVETKIDKEHDNYVGDVVSFIAAEDESSDDNERDMLSMEAWTDELPSSNVGSVLAAKATAKISDMLLGEQLWVVEVVGEEQGYLHVSDGSGRAWINATNYHIFGRKDILSVLVNRTTDIGVELIEADILQKHSSDFCIVDEEVYMQDFTDRIISGYITA